MVTFGCLPGPDELALTGGQVLGARLGIFAVAAVAGLGSKRLNGISG